MRELRVAISILMMTWLAAGLSGCGGRMGEQQKAPAGSTPTGAVPTPENAPGQPTPGPSPAGEAAPTVGQPLPATPGEAGARQPDRLIQLAKQDLARRTGVPEQEIRAASAAAETWRDASLGCGEPGRAYAQVLTPGFRILLEARGQSYEYHADSSRVVFCPKP